MHLGIVLDPLPVLRKEGDSGVEVVSGAGERPVETKVLAYEYIRTATVTRLRLC